MTTIALRVSGDVLFRGVTMMTVMPRLVELLKNCHDLDACGGLSRFSGRARSASRISGSLIQVARCNSDALLLGPPESLGWDDDPRENPASSDPIRARDPAFFFFAKLGM